MAECGAYKRIINLMNGDIKTALNEGTVSEERFEAESKIVKVDKDGTQVTIVYRKAETVTEVMIRHDTLSEAMLDILKNVGLGELAENLTKWGYTPRSVVLSYVGASGSLYLLIEGVRGRIPTVRVSVREDAYEASASYCVISEGENVCAFLKDLISIARRLRECLITSFR